MEKKVFLRALELEDYKTTFQWRNDNEIWEMVGGPKYFVSSEYERNWVANTINNTKDIRLGICDIENGVLIGLANLYELDWINRSGRISTMIGDKKYWSAGYATDAMKQFLDFAFNERGLNRLWTIILESNKASQKVALKCGVKHEGVLRNSIYKGGKYHNQVLFSILRHEYDEIIQKDFKQQEMINNDK